MDSRSGTLACLTGRVCHPWSLHYRQDRLALSTAGPSARCAAGPKSSLVPSIGVVAEHEDLSPREFLASRLSPRDNAGQLAASPGASSWSRTAPAPWGTDGSLNPASRPSCSARRASSPPWMPTHLPLGARFWRPRCRPPPRRSPRATPTQPGGSRPLGARSAPDCLQFPATRC